MPGAQIIDPGKQKSKPLLINRAALLELSGGKSLQL
jgi:hypothetical protein